MKLLRARFENFRLLKEVEFDFSTQTDKNLTVIRAANESGKTTLLTALQWGLFGDEALPERGRSFRLSPLDASSGERASVTITVEIDCEIPHRAGIRTYRLIRSVTETVKKGHWERSKANVNLFRLTAKGADKEDHPEAHIRPHLPPELREIFFTDGDRALSFIEGARGDQMKRVEGAIRSLLGLGVIEEALGHVRKVGGDLNQKVRKEAGNRDELDAATRKLAELQEEIPKLEKQVESAKEARINLEDLEEEADRKLSEGLRKGNREELEKEKRLAVQALQSAEKDAAHSAREHSNLFRSELLGIHLLAEPFRKAKEILDGLYRDGDIPKQTIPVLEDWLKQSKCICGESLDANDVDGQKRRKHIQHLIDESREPDEIRERITALYYSAGDLCTPVTPNAWTDRFSDVFERRQRANSQCQKHGEAVRAAEAKIAQLPDVDIQQLRLTRDRYRDQLKEAQSKEIRLSAQLDAREKEVKAAEAERVRLLQKDEKGLKFVAELEVAQDLHDVMINALETMKTRELAQVSEKMNALFLQMIGADQSQKSIITRAEITRDFRIIVFGRHDQPLDPSQDLNGASRRALTIAFILALTRISEVEAPNVIDTPLGMTSGYVKSAILQLAAQQSSQLILFLTHDEINGCEDIIDRFAGSVYTLTNPAHYPKILVNDTGVDDTRVLLCECNHRQDCDLCRRRELIEISENEFEQTGAQAVEA